MQQYHTRFCLYFEGATSLRGVSVATHARSCAQQRRDLASTCTATSQRCARDASPHPERAHMLVRETLRIEARDDGRGSDCTDGGVWNSRHAQALRAGRQAASRRDTTPGRASKSLLSSPCAAGLRDPRPHSTGASGACSKWIPMSRWWAKQLTASTLCTLAISAAVDVRLLDIRDGGPEDSAPSEAWRSHISS
jgi:hypothetical protein